MDFSDTQSLVPCRHCAELLQDGDRFCRFCGQGQEEDDDEAAFIDVSVPARPAGPRPAAGMSRKSALAIRNPAQGLMARPGLLHATARPALAGDVPEMWTRNSRNTSPVMLGIAALLALLFGVVLVYDLYTERRHDAQRLEQLGVKLDQMQRALDQGELGTVERTLSSLSTDADANADPRIVALKEALHRQQEGLQTPSDEAQASGASTMSASKPAPAPAPAPVVNPTPTTAQATERPTLTMPPQATSTPQDLPVGGTPAPPASPRLALPEPAPEPVLLSPTRDEPAQAVAITPLDDLPAAPPTAAAPPLAAPAAAPPVAAPAPAVAVTETPSPASAERPGVLGTDESPPGPSPGCSDALAAMALCTQP